MAYENKPTENPGGGNADRNTFHLASDMFPPGMAETLKAGEVIEFRIVAPPDQDGDVEVEYNYGDDKGGKETMSEGMHEDGEGEGGNWDEEARKVLDPQAPENEAM
jgi:hypothetical protein